MQKYRTFFVKNLITTALLVCLSITSVQYVVLVTYETFAKKACTSIVAETEADTEETKIENESEDLIDVTNKLALPGLNAHGSFPLHSFVNPHYFSRYQQINTPPPQSVYSLFQ